MKGKELKELADKVDDDTDIFVIFYASDEATEYIEQNLNDDSEIVTDPLTTEEWESVVRFLNNDEAIYQEVSESFHYYIETVITKRKEAAQWK